MNSKIYAKKYMLASHKVSMLTKLIGVVVTIPILVTIFVASASISIGETTGSTAKLVDINDRFDRHQSWHIVTTAQNTRAKAKDYLESGTQKFNRQDYRGALADFNLAIQIDPNFV
jgi:hypothetical protein